MNEVINKLVPQVVTAELLRLARIDREWIKFYPAQGELASKAIEVSLDQTPRPVWAAVPKYPTFLKAMFRDGGDVFGMWSLSVWMIDGPKLFQPTLEQCMALENIEIKLPLSSYTQPYPAIMIKLPFERYGKFDSVLCHQFKGPDKQPMATASINSVDHTWDVITTLLMPERALEQSISTFNDKYEPHYEPGTSPSELGTYSKRALRVAINSCLCLSNYETHLGYLRPKEVDRDRRLARERGTERGQQAKDRLTVAIQAVEFSDRTLKFHTTAGETRPEPGDPTGGREMPFHWRRGHWRDLGGRRVLVKPCMVRADKLLGESANTTTTIMG